MKIKILSILALLLTMTQGAWADATDGMLTGRFTVNAQGKKVAFSQGNLQAVFASAGSSCTWRFAANQWDYVGNAAANNSINGNGSVSAVGSVDLFGWSTPATTRGIHNSQSSGTYSGDFADWGTLAITNGGNTANSGWRTLTKDEWEYLINTRTSGSTVNGTTNARYTHATIRTNVSGVNGVILFPDGVTISADEATAWGTINGGSAWGTRCTAEQWTALAAKGCVFLPAAGYRYGSGANSVNSQGFYWSSTPSDSNNSRGVCFYTNYMNANYSLQKWAAHAVRLVITNYSVTYNANGGSGAPSAQEKCTDIDLTLSSSVPTRDGYTFAGWNTAADGSGTSYAAGATYSANADVTLYAHWTPVNDVTWDATDEEKSNWSISPVNPVAAGAAVTATYSGSKHVKSVTYRPAGTIGGQFTVNASGDKVYFSKGNLQYIGSAATPYWKFADNQWNYLGTLPRMLTATSSDGVRKQTRTRLQIKAAPIRGTNGARTPSPTVATESTADGAHWKEQSGRIFGTAATMQPTSVRWQPSIM